MCRGDVQVDQFAVWGFAFLEDVLLVEDLLQRDIVLLQQHVDRRLRVEAEPPKHFPLLFFLTGKKGRTTTATATQSEEESRGRTRGAVCA